VLNIHVLDTSPKRWLATLGGEHMASSQEVTMGLIERLTGAAQTAVLTVAPSGGQSASRANALAAATEVRDSRWQRAEAFAALARAADSQARPAAS
jgi:hypothetical protein